MSNRNKQGPKLKEVILLEFPNIKTLYEKGYTLSYLDKVTAIKAFKEAAPLTSSISILNKYEIN